MRLYGDLYDPNEDDVITVTLSENLENDARLERMTISEYVETMVEDYPEFTKVYTNAELEEDDDEPMLTDMYGWMSYNGLSLSDFI